MRNLRKMRKDRINQIIKLLLIKRKKTRISLQQMMIIRKRTKRKSN